MGLDINIGVDNYKEISSEPEYHAEENDFFHKHSLSRTFCNLMCRQGVTNGEPELNQIGRLTGVDVTPISAMDNYCDEESAEMQLSSVRNEQERQKLAATIKAHNDNLKGNIGLVLQTVNSLIERLSKIDNLDKQLDDGGEDTLGYEYYFTNFNNDKGDGYIDNNFGQDLRNFKRFLEYAKSKGATTTFFAYG